MLDCQKEIFLNTFKEGNYHPPLTKETKELVCDTAEFIIETDLGYEEFHTGADGYYGDIIWYKDNNAFWLQLDLDGEFFSMEEVIDKMGCLFGQGRTLESTLQNNRTLQR